MLKIIKILLLSLLILSPLMGKAQTKCFELKYRKDSLQVVIEREPEQGLTLKLQSKPQLSLQVQCLGKGQDLKCLGDDDSGSFQINFETNKIEVNHLTFGEPDSATKSFLFLKKPGVFDLKTCAP